MIVDEVKVKRIAFFEAEDHAPIPADSDRPKPLAISTQWMQSEAGRINLINGRRRIQARENAFDLIHICRVDSAAISQLEQTL